MSTLKELIDSNRELANATFAQAAAINKVVPVLESLRNEYHAIRSALEDIKTSSAVTLDNIKDTKGDVKTLSRDVTGVHALPPPAPPEHSDSTALQLVKAIVAAPLITKLSLILLAVLGLLIYALVTGGLHG